jgi:hypothetical protein
MPNEYNITIKKDIFQRCVVESGRQTIQRQQESDGPASEAAPEQSARRAASGLIATVVLLLLPPVNKQT